jgi:hypothetical protein
MDGEDALGGQDQGSSEMQLEAVIERRCRGTRGLRSSELRDAHRNRNRASLEMHFDAMIDRVWRFTWRPR